jgi:2-polyprenyl-3-methyl-5-hydroxy-6-metoxy-1,4-benzoquinol methylase
VGPFSFPWIFRRYYDYDAASDPVISLNQFQRDKIEEVLEGIQRGRYALEEAPCLCGDVDHNVLIARRDRYGFPAEFRLCRRCGILRTTPRFTPESLVRFYGQDYRQIYDPAYERGASAAEALFRAEVTRGAFIQEFLRPFIGDSRHLTVFDVGCGAGGVLVPFMGAGWSGHGCDIGGEYLEYGRKQGLNLEKGEFGELVGKYGKADLVILSHVIEHVASPAEFIREIHGGLKEGGFLFLESPGIFGIHRMNGDIMAYLQNVHLYNFTLRTLADTVTPLGFRKVRGDEYIHALFRKEDMGSQARPREIRPVRYIPILLYLMLIALAYRIVHLKGISALYGWTVGRKITAEHSGEREE